MQIYTSLAVAVLATAALATPVAKDGSQNRDRGKRLRELAAAALERTADEGRRRRWPIRGAGDASMSRPGTRPPSNLTHISGCAHKKCPRKEKLRLFRPEMPHYRKKDSVIAGSVW
ncbi:hypothetical protein BDK51DRAFT_27679 [Blyttiomyces helicus]|uniref:Uncharacterized protein n=1 Tax=Blyttiomyces helicus TaxID=388810 RepID=A0A4P9W5P2_9FUNG|nr:hypothetical protein BDK51DRAFT_27679 [Blyttiomyces helicus]|eukprot:RKO86635.1 hypothetical protein BDK51DRAFT_27679 [Blyttiomyces helicus]